VIALMLLAIVASRIAKGISAPLRRVAAATEDVIASGDRSLRVGERGTGEVGALSRAIDSMLDSLAAQDAALQTAQLEREEHLRDTWAKQREAEQQVRRQARDVIEETTGSVVEELTDVINQVEVVQRAGAAIDERVAAADDVSKDLIMMARESDDVVTALAASLRRVGGIVEIIAAVAGQTNLLALNATIEAARAGEAGRGFAVVAGEVKNLATATARSTQEITDTIASIERDAAAMAANLTAVASGISGINDATLQMQEVAGAQSATVRQLSAKVGQAIERIEAMTRLADEMERRSAPWGPIDGEAHLLASGTRFDVRLLDLSEGDLRCTILDGGSTPVVGTDVVIEMRFVGRALSVPAVVANHNPDASLGLRFVNPAPELTRLIRARLGPVAGNGSPALSSIGGRSTWQE
jgi:methyl-accepting chemotaxis protein